MAAAGARSGAAGQLFPLDGPGTVRQPGHDSNSAARVSRRIDVADAENDSSRLHVATAATDPDDHAMDDAPDVRGIHAQFRDGACVVLDRLEPGGHRHSGLCNRVGSTV